MSKAVVGAVERLIDVSLTRKDKRRLVRDLNREMWGKRLEILLKRIDQRQKNLPELTMGEITQEVKAVRRSRGSRRRTYRPPNQRTSSVLAT